MLGAGAALSFSLDHFNFDMAHAMEVHRGISKRAWPLRSVGRVLQVPCRSTRYQFGAISSIYDLIQFTCFMQDTGSIVQLEKRLSMRNRSAASFAFMLGRCDDGHSAVKEQRAVSIKFSNRRRIHCNSRHPLK